MDLQIVHDHIVKLSRQAGATLMEFFRAPIEESVKGALTDIVTPADKAAEKQIVGELLSVYPEHYIVGEEGGDAGVRIEEAAYRWYVDPLDGTVNFAHKFPHFSTSITLTDADMNLLVGVVYDPNRDELFSAIKGKGAWLNGEAIHVSDKKSLGESIVCSGFPYDKWTSPDNNLAEWSRFVTRTRGVRRLGSAALDSCYVACGRLDGYWEAKINAWDIAAGVLIVKEAGGQASDYRGGTQASILTERNILVSNGIIHQAMVDLLTAKS